MPGAGRGARTLTPEFTDNRPVSVSPTAVSGWRVILTLVHRGTEKARPAGDHREGVT